MQKIEKIWYTDPRGYELRGPISNTSTDGAGIFRQAAVDRYQRNLMSSEEGSMESKVLKVLTHCVLFDLWSGEHGITDDTDAKHDAKCLRGCCKSASRGLQVVNHTFYGSDFRRILSALGHSKKDVATMLDPEDEQNVPAMLLFFTALSKLADVSAETLSAAGLGHTATLVVKTYELQLLGAVAQAYVFLLTGFDKSITEHLVSLFPGYPPLSWAAQGGARRSCAHDGSARGAGGGQPARPGGAAPARDLPWRRRGQ